MTHKKTNYSFSFKQLFQMLSDEEMTISLNSNFKMLIQKDKY